MLGRGLDDLGIHDHPLPTQVGRRLCNLGFTLVATSGTAEILESARIPVARINKVLQGSPHVVDAIREGTVQLVINTTQDTSPRAIGPRIEASSKPQRVARTVTEHTSGQVEPAEVTPQSTPTGPRSKTCRRFGVYGAVTTMRTALRLEFLDGSMILRILQKLRQQRIRSLWTYVAGGQSATAFTGVRDGG
jgi:hypothetical protein